MLTGAGATRASGVGLVAAHVSAGRELLWQLPHSNCSILSTWRKGALQEWGTQVTLPQCSELVALTVLRAALTTCAVK